VSGDDPSFVLSGWPRITCRISWLSEEITALTTACGGLFGESFLTDIKLLFLFFHLQQVGMMWGRNIQFVYMRPLREATYAR